MPIIDVKRCARCGEDHRRLVAERLVNPADEWNFWTICPRLGQPILVRVVTVKDKTKEAGVGSVNGRAKVRVEGKGYAMKMGGSEAMVDVDTKGDGLVPEDKVKRKRDRDAEGGALEEVSAAQKGEAKPQKEEGN